MTSKTRKTKDSLTFDEYKTIKDEIIEISEQRFENILTKRLREFKNSLMEELNIKFDAMDSKFSSLEKRMTFLTWFLPVFITLLMLTLKYFEK
jgi:hypothetical protein